MRTVEDVDGNTYLLMKQGTDSWLVADPVTGETSYRPATALELTGESPLVTAASAVPEPVRRVITATATEEAIGLLVRLADHGPTPAKTLLEEVEQCESDLQGLLAELQAADAITRTEVGTEPAYTLTETAADGIAALRSGSDTDQP